MAWFQPAVPLLPDLIAANGRWHAAEPALVDGAEVMSWRDLDEATARAARAFAGLGVRPRERVALLADTCRETAIAMLGIIRAGAVAVPLNVSITDEAVAGMCADAAVVAVFASGAQCDRIDALRAANALSARHFIGCDGARTGWHELGALIAAEPLQAPQVAIAPEDECNLIYSSGTTALPKGIVHTHACRMSWAYDCALALRYRSGCRTLCSLGLFSNITWVSMLATILVGGTIVLLRRFSTRDALRIIEAERITHGAFVPIQLERLLTEPSRAEFQTSSLETLMCCGSPLASEVKRRFAAEFDCRLIELYGLTEGLFTILAPEDFERKLDSVGKPVFGSEIRILGDDDRELACGETGEVVGRSRLVMAGYHERDAANREATWVDADGRKWLRTGDLGRLDGDGFLYVVDRKKDMILSGGQNIYPADIENVLRQNPAVLEVAAVGVKSAKWGETPVAVIVPRTGSLVDEVTLRDWANGRVGRQQRIAAVVVREALPRNPNGKILKRELRSELERRESLQTDAPFREVYYVSADGLRLYTRVYETAGAGAPAVLCLPGLTRNSRDFEVLASHLAHRYRVLCPDLRGRGYSARDPNWQNYQPPTYVADVLALLKALAVPRVAIIGTSLGGLLAMMLAANMQERVAGIVLNDIGPEIDPAGLARIRGYVGQLPAVGTWPEAATQLRSVFGSAWPDLDDAAWLRLARRSYREDASGTPVLDCDPAVGNVLRSAPTQPADLWPLWAALGPVPALAIRGERSDILSVTTFERMQHEKADLVRQTVARRGHVPLLDEPDCLPAIDAFLARLDYRAREA
jgi:acyl-CoA synthetase (AMP-forming)/AMP-acid ligase II/pimeloyl-ACP methyl ester carboxylesterase